MRKIVKSSFLVCSFYKYTAKLCFILQSAKFFAKNNTKFHQTHIMPARHHFPHSDFHTLFG